MTTKSPEPPKDAGSSTSSVPVRVTSSGDQTTATQRAAPPGSTAPAQPTKGAAPPAKSAAPPAKATTTPPATPRRQRRGGGGAAVILAVLSLLVAVGASGISLYALDVAREAKSQTAPTAPANDRQANRPPSANASAAVAPTPTPRGTTFLAELVRTEVQLPSPDNCNSIYVDVDTTQVGVYAGHEFYLSSCLGPAAMRIDRTSGAAPTSENPTAEACAAQLAGASTSSELVLPVRAGLTFCLLTNKADATQQRIPQRIGIVEVKETRPDRSVTVAISTYRVLNPS